MMVEEIGKEVPGGPKSVTDAAVPGTGLDGVPGQSAKNDAGLSIRKNFLHKGFIIEPGWIEVIFIIEFRYRLDYFCRWH